MRKLRGRAHIDQIVIVPEFIDRCKRYYRLHLVYRPHQLVLLACLARSSGVADRRNGAVQVSMDLFGQAMGNALYLSDIFD